MKDLHASQKFLKRIKEEIDSDPKVNVIVDAGCGEMGVEIRDLAEKYPKKFFVGYDYIRRPGGKENKTDNLEFVRAYHQFLPFRQDAIDLLYAHNSLRNSPLEAQSYLEFGDVLRANGRFITDTWYDGNTLVEKCGFLFLRNCKFYENSSGVKHAYIYGASKRFDTQTIKDVYELRKDLPLRTMLSFP